MPFRSQAQRRFLYAKHPKIARKWEKEGNTPKHIPEKIGNDEKEYVKRHYKKRNRTRLD